MEKIEKTPLELNLEIEMETKRNIQRIRMTKTVYAGFIPQHGMEILDSEILFRVKTIALAGLQTLKHSASPLRQARGQIQGSFRVVSKLRPRDEETLKESVEYFKKEGWKVEQ